MKTATVQELLTGTFGSVTLRKGVFICKREYFYTNGCDTTRLQDAIKKLIPTAKIVDAKNHYHSWPTSSYFEVRFSIPVEVKVA